MVGFGPVGHGSVVASGSVDRCEYTDSASRRRGVWSGGGGMVRRCHRFGSEVGMVCKVGLVMVEAGSAAGNGPDGGWFGCGAGPVLGGSRTNFHPTHMPPKVGRVYVHAVLCFELGSFRPVPNAESTGPAIDSCL